MSNIKCYLCGWETMKIMTESFSTIPEEVTKEEFPRFFFGNSQISYIQCERCHTTIYQNWYWDLHIPPVGAAVRKGNWQLNEALMRKYYYWDEGLQKVVHIDDKPKPKSKQELDLTKLSPDILKMLAKVLKEEE